MTINTIGIDLAKSVFHIHGVDEKGKTVLKKKLMRDEVLEFMANTSKCLVGLEACGGAHYWAREISKFGHDVKLMAPQFVKPYVKSNKNDVADAEAICEAVSRPNMRFVPLKNEDQQQILMVHRSRKRMVKARTALVNEMRGYLHEFGVVVAPGRKAFKGRLEVILASDDCRIPAMAFEEFQEMIEEYNALEKRIKAKEKQLELIAKNCPRCQRLLAMPGIGSLTATAMVASIGNASAFKNARQLAAWLGLVPKQYSTGGKQTLLGISKRGDGYLRGLLVHGARSVLRVYVENKQDNDPNSRKKWALSLTDRRGYNRTSVALANKAARNIWAILHHNREYDPHYSRHHVIAHKTNAA